MDEPGQFFDYLIRLGVVALLVLANGFFVTSEYSFVGVRRARVTALAAGGNRKARQLLHVLDHLDAYISATQLGVTLASLAIGWVGEPTVARLFDALFVRVMPRWAALAAAHTVAIAIAFAVITVFHIVIGELVPKALALQRSESVALAIVGPISVFQSILRTPIWALNKAGFLVGRLIGLQRTARHSAVYSEEELRHLIELSNQGGKLGPDQGAILARALDFSALTAQDAMVPRTQVEGINAAMPLDQIIQTFLESGYSRLPVYRETLDDTIGVLYSKELLKFWDNRAAFKLESTLHPVRFIPDNMRLDVVLRRMQEEHFHFAVVTDEHGGVEGILTIEDLLEEIVGEINDEFDEETTQLVHRRADGSYLLDAALPIRSANRRLGLHLPEDGAYNTLAGFLMAQSGRVLREGEKVVYGDAEFVVERADRQRIRMVRLVLKPQETAA